MVDKEHEEWLKELVQRARREREARRILKGVLELDATGE